MSLPPEKLTILYASSEVYPFMKTGGLADVAQSLPTAIRSIGADIRIIMPNYGSLNTANCTCEVIAQFEINQEQVRLIATHIPDTSVPVILVDCPKWFARKGNPYLDAEGLPWPDNAQRFALFSKVIGMVAMDQAGLKWLPTIVHCNDWQTGLALALLHKEKVRKGLVFTIHNIAYQGIFPHADFESLELPDELWSIDILEYYGQMSFLKGGIVCSNQLNTVSPRFAEEIQTEEYGFGLDGLLRSMSGKLSGIINGVDLNEWSPKKDKYISYCYDKDHLEIKTENKLELQQKFGFVIDKNIPLFVSITRLVEQKGIDLIIEIIEQLLALEVQIIILGSGNDKIENRLVEIAHSNSNKIHVVIGYDENLAHKLTAAADIYLMPSRFEPCGLNQMYSQIYGTVPVVRNTGGLADTVIDYKEDPQENRNATGFVFENSESDELLRTIKRALDSFKNKKLWRQIQQNGMEQDYSWQSSATQYLSIYQKSLK